MAAARARPQAAAILCRRGACPPRAIKRVIASRPTSSLSSAGRKASGKSCYEPITQERAVRRYTAARENRGDESGRRKESREDLVAPLDRRPRNGWTHAGGAQRQEVHSGLRDRKHGGAEARGVLADPPVQRAHDQDRESRASGGRGTPRRRRWRQGGWLIMA